MVHLVSQKQAETSENVSRKQFKPVVPREIGLESSLAQAQGLAFLDLGPTSLKPPLLRTMNELFSDQFKACAME